MSNFDPTDKVLKVQEKAPVAEAMYFSGGEGSAKKIIDWVRSYYGDARHVPDGPSITPEYLTITDDGSWFSESRTTIRAGKWIVYNHGRFERHTTDDMRDMFNLITEETDA